MDNIDTHNCQGFAGYIKAYIFQIYQEACTIDDCYIHNQNIVTHPPSVY